MTREQAEYIAIVIELARDSALRESSKNERAIADAEKIARRYRELKGTMSFTLAAYEATVEFLINFDEDPRLVSYAHDMSTCTVNHKGEQFLYNLCSNQNIR